MTNQFWIGDSCTGSRLGKHDYYAPIADARSHYLAKIADPARKIILSTWPFVHAVVWDIKRPWFESGWPLDPLVIPILDALNDAGINTISSCQGYGNHSTPHILLACGFDDAMRAKDLIERHNDHERPFNQPMFAVESPRPDQGGQGWSIYFHDSIALMAWNVAAGVSLEDQLKVPEGWKGKVARADDIQKLL